MLTTDKANGPKDVKRSSPSSTLALVIVGLVLLSPFWDWLIQITSWVVWLTCSLALWELAKAKLLPAKDGALAQIGLMLVTFCSLRVVFGWSTPLTALSPWYYCAVTVPALDTFVGLDHILGVIRFLASGKGTPFLPRSQ